MSLKASKSKVRQANTKGHSGPLVSSKCEQRVKSSLQILTAPT